MRHRRSLVLAFAYVGAAWATHCSFTNDLDSLGAGLPQADGGLNGADARSPATDDASSGGQGDDGREGSTPDDSGVLADTATADTSPAGNDGTDADADADAAAGDAGPRNDPPLFQDSGTPHYCESHTASAFCADFDEAPLPSGFTSSEGSFLLLTSTQSSSKPNDLLLLIPPQSGGGTLSSKLSRSFTEAASNIVLAFDFFPENVNTTPSGILFAALDFLGNASAKYSVRLAYNQGATRIEESYLGFPTDVFHSSFNLPVGVWSRVRLELGFATDAGADGGVPTIAAYVDDVLQGVKEPSSPPVNVDTRASLLVGAVYGTLPHNGWTFRYDNVTLDLH